jgi:two-component system OmpR family response regulator
LRAVNTALKDAADAGDWGQDGIAAVTALASQPYNLVLLDLGLPRQDGLSVLRDLRQAGHAMPVLILTARDAISDRVSGLDAGADDYLVKPFDLSELLARLRVLSRRQAGAPTAVLSNGLISLDLGTRLAQSGSTDVRLTAREFALLQALLMRPGAILSRSALEDRLYGWDQEVESNAVEVLIHGLRKKLGSSTIKNVRGLGWMVDKST